MSGQMTSRGMCSIYLYWSPLIAVTVKYKIKHQAMYNSENITYLLPQCAGTRAVNIQTRDAHIYTHTQRHNICFVCSGITK